MEKEKEVPRSNICKISVRIQIFWAWPGSREYRFFPVGRSMGMSTWRTFQFDVELPI
jgi:hypothetical protein